MQTWAKRIQKHTVTNAKWLVWLGCIVSAVAMLLKAIFCRSKNTEEVMPPLDYEKKHWHKYDWQKWINDNKDEWN